MVWALSLSPWIWNHAEFCYWAGWHKSHVQLNTSKVLQQDICHKAKKASQDADFQHDHWSLPSKGEGHVPVLPTAAQPAAIALCKTLLTFFTQTVPVSHYSQTKEPTVYF